MSYFVCQDFIIINPHTHTRIVSFHINKILYYMIYLRLEYPTIKNFDENNNCPSFDHTKKYFFLKLPTFNL